MEAESLNEVVFGVNGEVRRLTNADPEVTLLNYLRNVAGLTGTKLGCGEGGCGACTVVVQVQENGKIAHRSVNACVTPVCAVDGMNVITVEGLGTSTNLHPIQERMVKNHGSQCGFCTPGILMSMYALLQRKPETPTRMEIEMAFDGNLCRCTGYRPILSAFSDFSLDGTPRGETMPFPTELAHRVPRPLTIAGSRATWYRPMDLDQFLQLKLRFPNARIVGGNSELEIERKFRNSFFGVLITTTHVNEINTIREDEKGMHIGAGVRLAQLEHTLRHSIARHNNEGKTRFFEAVLSQLRWFAGGQIRNTATLGGNVATASPISDLNPLWMAFGSTFTLISASTRATREVNARDFFLGYRKVDLAPEELLLSVFLRYSDAAIGEYGESYKVSRRREDDIALVNAGAYIQIGDDGVVKDAHFAFGGMAAKTENAPKTRDAIIGKTLTLDNIQTAVDALATDLPLPPGAPGGMIEFRRSVAASFLFKFFLQIQNRHSALAINPPDVSATVRNHDRPLTSAAIHHHTAPPAPADSAPDRTVGTSVPHVASHLQCTGEAEYLDDIKNTPGTLYAGLVLSTVAHGRILSVDYSAALALPGVRGYVCSADVPGKKIFGAIVQDEEVFASEEVHHMGQVIAVVAADTQVLARRAAAMVVVKYETLPVILSIDEAIKANSFFPGSPKLERGDVDAAMAAAPFTVEGDVRIGGQEHFYLETQASLCLPQEGGEMTIYSSTQNPTKTQGVVANVLGVAKNKIVVKVKRMGGGFGGKETRNIFLTSALAVAAKKLKKPVKLMLERDEDMCITGQRHPFYSKYKIGFSADGRLLAIDLQLFSNAGCFLDLSMPVLERAVFHSDGAYKCDNVRVSGRLCKTNLPPNTAFRGFGGPQGVMIAENYLDHVARTLKISPEEVREINLYREGETTPFNQVLEDCHVREMWTQLKISSEFEQRKKEIQAFNSKNRWRKRGIAMTPVKFGMSFTANFMNAASALVHVYTDGSVLVSHGGTEMGQGLHTKMAMVAADAFGIPLANIHIKETSTDACANTHPTAASVSADLNGMAVWTACREIVARMKIVRDEKPELTFGEAAMECWFRQIDLSAHGYYKTPDLGWDWEAGKGKPFHYYSYGVSCTEVEIDCLTGDHNVLRVDLLHDVGHSLNPAIDVGQIEGAFIQGYGLFCLEELVWTPAGALFTRGPSTYKIPSFNDIPLDFRTALYSSAGTRGRTIMSSKGVGEPPLLLASSVVFAIKNAISSARQDYSDAKTDTFFRLDCPATCERIRMACPDFITDKFVPEIDTYAPKGYW